MKLIKLSILLSLTLLALTGCKKDEELQTTDRGPAMSVDSYDKTAQMGDQIAFKVTLQDPIALSTLKAQLFFDTDMVADVTIRTKTNGTYEGVVNVPYYKNIPDGTATLRLIAQNIQFGLTTQEYDVAVSRPDFTYLTLVAADGTETRMTRVSKYNYSVTAAFPQKLKALIKAPAFASKKQVVFGWASAAVSTESEATIPFTNSNAGTYAVTLNTLTFEATPFVILKLNGSEMTMVDDDNYALTADFTKGQALTVTGISDLEDWWIDPDFLSKNTDGTFKFLPIDGHYRITANFKYKYFIVDAMQGNATAILQKDGSGALWVVGEGIGKPALTNEVGWVPERGLCMAPVAKGKYQVTAVAGLSLNPAKINFKFFSANHDWMGGFSNGELTSTSTIAYVGNGTNGRDGGNIGNFAALELGGVYVFTVDVTAGIDHAVMTVEKTGTQPLPQLDVQFAGTKLAFEDMNTYSGTVNLTKEQALTLKVDGAVPDLTKWWICPDWISLSATGAKFVPATGKYKVTLKNMRTGTPYAKFVRLDDSGNPMTLQTDGTGAVWLFGYGVGYPSQDSQFGWDGNTAYCMPEVAPKVYRLTGTTGPEKGSVVGNTFRYDYISCKFFADTSWHGEFVGPFVTGTGALLKNSGNIELADGVQLAQGATYVLTVDMSGGVANKTVKFEKK